MSNFSSVLHTLAHAVETIADGGGPFWDPPATQHPPVQTPNAEEPSAQPEPPVPQSR